MKKLRVAFAFLTVLYDDAKLRGSFLQNLLHLQRLSLKLKLARRKLVVVSLTEHMGDVVAAEPVVREVRKRHPSAYLLYITGKRYFDLIKDHPQVQTTLGVTCFTEWLLLRKFISSRNVYDLHLAGKVCATHGFQQVKRSNPFDITIDNYYHKGNLLYAFSRTAGLEMDETTAPQLYLSPTRPALQKPYAVLHTHANEAARNWTPACWDAVADQILSAGMQVVEVGLQRNLLLTRAGVIDKTGTQSYSYLHGLLQGANLFVGVDSGLAHLANVLQLSSLVLIGEKHGFRRYLPYSGYFQAEAASIIHYFDGPLCNMPCTEIAPLLTHKLSPTLPQCP